jgi:hypothetical protein
VKSRRRPVAILILACYFILVGSIEFAVRFPELLAGHGYSFLAELVELLAIVAGAFMLRGQNWARWLAVAWAGFHVILSIQAPRDLIIHSLLFAVIAWFLLRPSSANYFQGAGSVGEQV